MYQNNINMTIYILDIKKELSPIYSSIWVCYKVTSSSADVCVVHYVDVCC